MKRAKEMYLSAENGFEAVQMYEAAPQAIKVIFMGMAFVFRYLASSTLTQTDIAMPIKDGIEATREIRQFEAENKLPRVRITALTCFSSDQYQRDAFAAGVVIFLVKPVPMKALKPVLEMDPNVVTPA